MTANHAKIAMATYLGADGILAQYIPNYVLRPEQIVMSEAILDAINSATHLIVEAGTGIGKTFAYLLPALLTDKRVIISTGSKALQDQLINKDLPLIMKVLPQSNQPIILKGRTNYLCLERLHKYYQHSDMSEKLLSELSYIREWSSTTRNGDLNQCDKIGENSAVLGYVTSSNDNCLGSECHYFNECFLFKARRRAMVAKVVVINHHLFFADLKLKQQELGDLIPDSSVLIFDEAHQLIDIASQFFGEQVTSRQLLDLTKDLQIFYQLEATDWGQLQKCVEQLTFTIEQFRTILAQIEFKSDLRKVFLLNSVKSCYQQFWDKLCFCEDVLNSSLERANEVVQFVQRIIEIKRKLTLITQFESLGFSYWFECNAHYFVLALTPLSVAQQFSELFIQKKINSWIFTSATLSVNNNFHYFSEQLGLTKTRQLFLASPFDYAKQALLYVPRHLPELDHNQAALKLAEKLSPIIQLNKGRCFFLSTSHHMVQQLTVAFRQYLSLPVLAQGEQSKHQLIQTFLTQGNALLIATQSFWEGIDIPGSALSCVIIDRIPFTSPDEPLLKAKIAESRQNQGEPFFDIQLPEAIINLKQGVGRLIRHHHDRGVIIICDKRLVTRAYGAIILNSLPSFTRTRNQMTVINFLAKESSG